MSGPRVGPPLTVLYRGTITDTASVIGLVMTKKNIGKIALVCDLSAEILEYCKKLNGWLKRSGNCEILIHPKLSDKDLKNLIDKPYLDWGWGENECKTVIALSGLSLPPQMSA